MSKTVAIHQPNYIPWMGYFYKIAQSDLFVLLDDVQYIKQSVASRNLIKNKNGAAIWLSVPVKISQGHKQTYREIGIDYSQRWVNKHLNLLSDAYRKAPYFEQFFTDFQVLISVRYDCLADINRQIILWLAELMQLDQKTEIILSSDLHTVFEEKNDRNIEICVHLGATTYLSGTGGSKYNAVERFTQHEIQVAYSQFVQPIYPQLNGDFIPHLSVLDALFNCGAEQTSRLLI